MKITADVFEAYLKCPTKCWLRAAGESSASSTYPEWAKTQSKLCFQYSSMNLTAMSRVVSSDWEEVPLLSTASSAKVISSANL